MGNYWMVTIWVTLPCTLFFSLQGPTNRNIKSGTSHLQYGFTHWDSPLSQPSSSLSLWPHSNLPTGSLYGCPSSTVPLHSRVNYLLHSYGFGCQPLGDPHGSSFLETCSSSLPFQTSPCPSYGSHCPLPKGNAQSMPFYNIFFCMARSTPTGLSNEVLPISMPSWVRHSIPMKITDLGLTSLSHSTLFSIV